MRILTALLALGASASVSASAAAAGADAVRLGNLKFAHYGAVSYMQEIGREHGLDVQERVFAKGVDLIPALVAGEIDIAASSSDAAIAARVAGAPIYVVAGFAKGGARIVVKDGIKSLAELRGKKVGVARGGAQELLLLAELAKAGLSWSDRPGKDVLILYLAYADLNQALASGNIDAMCQSEPQSAQAIARGFGKELMKPYDTPLGEPVRALVMTEKLYKGKPDVARRVLEAFVDATRRFETDPALASRWVREKMFKGQLSETDYKDAMSNAPLTTDITVAHIQTTADLMVKYGVGRLPKAPDAREFVKLDLLEKAKSALPVTKAKR
ncbi:MAG TPA: ABC transporter substrate-binding protein [Polyangia bacterium]|nr:ABC transporter substrate-binding protein [Polyangia bacterium]